MNVTKVLSNICSSSKNGNGDIKDERNEPLLAGGGEDRRAFQLDEAQTQLTSYRTYLLKTERSPHK